MRDESTFTRHQWEWASEQLLFSTRVYSHLNKLYYWHLRIPPRSQGVDGHGRFDLIRALDLNDRQVLSGCNVRGYATSGYESFYFT